MEKIKREVIKKHLEGWERDLRNTSIEHFAKSGNVSGSFFMALKDMLDDYVEQLRLHNVVGQSEQLVCEHKYQDNVCDWRGVRKCIICGQMEKKNYATEEQKTDNIQGTGVLPCVSEPLLWKDILYDFYVEHDKQISNGEYAGKMILVFRDWLEKNYQVPKRIKSGDKRTKPLAENRETETYYDNGQLMSRETYKDGKRDGLVEWWYSDGKPMDRATYKNGNRHGLREGWYENGQLSSRCNYKNGNLAGLRETWYSNGQPCSRANYKDSELNGLYEYWHDNGQLKTRENYKNDKREGLRETWDRDGQLKESATYKDGEKQ